MTLGNRVGWCGIVLFIAVGAGAFGSHGLRGLVSPELIEVWKTAVLYQLIHGLALLLIAILLELRPAQLLAKAWLTMLLGVGLFSGSLYLIVLTGNRWLGPVTPIGGLILLLSWLMVAWGGFREKSY